MSALRQRTTRESGHKPKELPVLEGFEDAPRSPTRSVSLLSSIAGISGFIGGLAGLLWRGTGEAVTATTFLGEEVELYGRGLYDNDTLFFAASNFATDLVMVVLGVPLLTIALRMHAKGSLRGKFLLLGVLGFFVYYGATYALGGVAYNDLFLLYVAIFSTSLFAFIKAFTSFNESTLALSLHDRPPRRLAGIFMLASAVVTAAVWLIEPVGSALSGDMPKSLETHTTLFTHAFDLAVIVPAAFIAGVMILRRESFGYVVAFSLLILEAFLLPIISIATLIQLDLGVEFEPAEIVGPIMGFGVLAVTSLWVTTAILRKVPKSPTNDMEVEL